MNTNYMGYDFITEKYFASVAGHHAGTWGTPTVLNHGPSDTLCGKYVKTKAVF